jgi:hypothetical protein
VIGAVDAHVLKERSGVELMQECERGMKDAILMGISRIYALETRTWSAPPSMLMSEHRHLILISRTEPSW